ncbi:MAG: hypothetical protein ACPGEG_10445, partial [Salibacteraceae bacterium]
VTLLSDLRENIAKELNITIELKKINDEFIDEIDNLIETNQGNCKVFMHFIDEKEKINSKGLLRGKRVMISDELIDKLERMDVEFSLN